MRPRNKHRNKVINHNAGPVPITPFSQREPGNLGFFRRLLGWIARGAYKSNIGGTSCPS
jgi:hypothetical protein